jgi:hypothetical protein
MERMNRDFYFSAKMQEMCDWLDSLEREKVKRHTVNIEGTDFPFTLQVEHGKPHSAKWDDMFFVGAAHSDAITYKFQ